MTSKHSTLRESIIQAVVKQVIPSEYLKSHTQLIINPSGKFVIGGPYGDAGLTGRKIIVDTYGGWGAHGGGAFSGKDPSKVDRSAAYAARWVAKSMVDAELCRRCLIQISYGIGLAYPLSVNIDTFGTGKYSDTNLVRVINDNFDLRPGIILKKLDLRRPIYSKTACYGHFGRIEESDFKWEISRRIEPASYENLQLI